MKKIDEHTVVLCCGRKKCPTITHNPQTGNFDIKDDFGGSVTLNNNEFLMLKEALDFYTSEQTKHKDD